MTTIRFGTLADVDAVAALHEISFDAAGSLLTLAGPRFVRAAYRFAATAPESFLLIAEVDGRFAGFVSVCDRPYLGPLVRSEAIPLVLSLLSRPTRLLHPAFRKRLRRGGGEAHPEGAAQLFVVAVVPELRGRGVFGELVARAEEESARRGATAITAGVHRGNDASRRAFRKAGWTETPELASEETVTFVKPLPRRGLRTLHASAHGAAFTQYRMPMLRGLLARGHAVTLWCPDDAAARTLRGQGFEHRAAPVPPRPTLFLPLEILRLARFLRRRRFDVVVGHQPLGAITGILAAKLAGVPTTIYSTGGLKHQPDGAGLRNRLLRAGELALIRAATATFLVNREDEAALLAEPSVAPKAFRVGPLGGCGVDTSVFRSESRLTRRDAARSELGFAPGEFVVAYAGRLVWEKGFRELIEAARILRALRPEVRIVVFGRGPEAEAIERAGAGLLTFLGYRAPQHAWLPAADLFVLPSYREGMPVALLEALALGLPAVATDIRGSRELIRNGETSWLVPVRDAAALAAAIAGAAAGRERAAAMGLRAASEVAELYAEGRLAPATLDLIERLARRDPTSETR